MTTQTLRQTFLDFFAAREHRVRPSAPLVLHNDPTSFFTSAGMQPYMAAFRGEEPPPAPRVVSIQKCTRTGDLEGVGAYNRYHTFFEMLGNFSFGDYFKAGAIDLAWEFVHETLGLPTEALWIGVYTDDDEAAELWRDRTDIAPERILRFGREDNWWPKLRWAGPCGPCTEVHMDLGPSFGCPGGCEMGCARCNRYLELWNLVFQQYTEAEDGALTPLPQPGIDTGMGLERLALVMQNKRYTCETDELWSILQAALEQINLSRSRPYAYGDEPAHDSGLRIITDHLRAAAFLMSDGITPSNEGPGYVLRRFIRRAYRYGRNLGATGPFLHAALPAVERAMGQAYPELTPKLGYAQRLLRAEEERFSTTLEQGLGLFEELAEQVAARHQTQLPGEQAFRLYDTYGFPLDLTRELAQDRGLSVDEAGFTAAMEQQRRRSRGEAIGLQKHTEAAELPPSEFVGYEILSAEATVLALLVEGERVEQADPGAEVAVALDRTPFYAEHGGQVADHGLLVCGEARVVVEQVQPGGESYLHRGRLSGGVLRVGDRITATVDAERRAAIRRHHTATHLLQAALREALGQHVTQAGSWVGPDRLRFDFTHHEQVSEETLAALERRVNEWIVQDLPVTCTEQALREAQAEGILALFGETYGEQVRVIRAGEVSAELCGGTHAARTGEIGCFRLLAESSVAAGLRRIEGVTGLAALERWRQETGLLRELSHELACGFEELPERIGVLRRQVRELEKRVQEARRASAAVNVDQIAAAVETVNDGLRLIAQVVPEADRDLVGSLADQVTSRAPEAIVLLAGTQEDSASFVCKVPEALVQRGVKAGDLIRAACQAAGGGGGGRPQFAQGGGRAEQVNEGLEAARRLLAGEG